MNKSVCNSKQEWNHNECECECNSSLCNSSMCNGEFNKACKVDEYLHAKNSSSKKWLFGKLLLTCEDETALLDKMVT